MMKKRVTLLHSDAAAHLSAQENDDRSALLKYDASKRFFYPVTVCTVDQLFSFVYKYRGSEILLATLKYSKVVIDEIQSYDPKLITKLIYGLELISKAGGKYAIITATLPNVLLYFLDRYNIPHLPQQNFLLDKIRHRINYVQADDFDYVKIADNGRYKKVLVICNTVKRACDVWQKLHDDFPDLNVKLLHSKYMRKHRNALEKLVIDFAADENATGVWVTTQLVEASLDIDFDMLFTEMCTADSLLQRMGRCYRKRQYTDKEPNIFIVDNHNGYGRVYKYTEIYDRSVEFLQEYNGELFSEQQKMNYVDRVYDAAELRNISRAMGKGYYKDILDTIKTCRMLCAFDINKEQAKHQMREIVSYMIIPEQVYNSKLDEFMQAYDVLTDRKRRNFGERNKAKQFIEDHAINLGNRDLRSRERCKSLFEGLEYYTLDYKYEFDEQTMT